MDYKKLTPRNVYDHEFEVPELAELLTDVTECTTQHRTTIAPRPKNKRFAKRYRLLDKDLKQLIFELTPFDFVEAKPNKGPLCKTPEHKDEIVFVFVLQKCLYNFDINEEELVHVYIKITVVTNKGNQLRVIVISIHNSEKKYCYYFR